MATGLGALGVNIVHELSRRTNDVLLSCAAGIMLAATFFSLLAPGIEVALSRSPSTWLAAAVVSAGVLLGTGGLAPAHRAIPHGHFVSGREGPPAAEVRRVWLFVLAITLHDLPEGMAVGVGAGDVTSGMPLAIDIGVQNIPEGLAVAAARVSIGYSATHAFLVDLGTGVIEAVGAGFGTAAAALAEPLLPWSLAFAAGAMLFVISSEIIPETFRDEHKGASTFALIAGFLAMMALDVSMG